MKVTYDPEVDVLRIVLAETPIEESDEDKPGVILSPQRGVRRNQVEGGHRSPKRKRGTRFSLARASG